VINDLPKMDLVFIYGGHSIETIENDWRYTQKIMGIIQSLSLMIIRIEKMLDAKRLLMQ